MEINVVQLDPMSLNSSFNLKTLLFESKVEKCSNTL